MVLFPRAAVEQSAVGDYSYIQADSQLLNAEVGPFCSIAAQVSVGLAAHATSMVSTSPVFYDPAQPLPRFFVQERLFTATLPRTIVGADVWIGQRAMIKAGVRIGVGAIVGAGAVVTKDVPAYTITAGNPSRVIRPRFSVDVCERLLASRWWTWDTPRLHEFASLFADPEALLSKLGNLESTRR